LKVKSSDTRMIDVSAKRVTLRRARAKGFIRLAPKTLKAIREERIPKGDVLNTARVGGIMAAKRTSDLLPLCHPVPVSNVEVVLDVQAKGVAIVATAKARARTGVEMEALVAVSAAALTVYDMCKSLDRDAVIGEIELMAKSGGRSGKYVKAT